MFRTLKLYFQLTVLLVLVSVFIFVLYDFNLKNRNLTTVNKIERWIVLDDVTFPCHDVTTLTSQEGWKVVVVTDQKKDIRGCSFPRCHLLTEHGVVEQLNHSTTVNLPNPPSKLSGYLFAIQSGARIILDAECSLQISDIAQSFRLDERHQSGLTNIGTQYFNPYEHFGIFQAIPNEFIDLSTTKEKSNTDMYFITDWNAVPIRQGVLLSESTCFKRNGDALDLHYIIRDAAPVSYINHTLAPFSTGPTIFFEEAFPLLFTPPGMDAEAIKMFRTLWFNEMNFQHLITTAFYYVYNSNQGQSVTCSNSSTLNYKVNLLSILNCMKDFSYEENSGSFTGSLQKVWNCFSTQIPHLDSFEKIESNFAEWNSHLSALGLTENNTVQFKRQYMYSIKYRIPRQVQEFRNLTAKTENAILNDVISLCGKTELYKLNALQRMSDPVIKDIVLIIVINYQKVFSSIAYNEYIHRQYFKYIIYCVPSLNEFEDYSQTMGFDYLTFIDGLTFGWWFYYECAASVMKLSLPVKGYLQIGDDVLLNTWNIVAMPRDGMMLSFSQRFVELNQIKINFSWPFWNTYLGQSAVQLSLQELQNASPSQTDAESSKYPRVHYSSFAAKFIRNLYGNIGPRMSVFGAGDIFYVPESLANEYITATDIFRRNSCMVELALRVIYYGLKQPEKKRAFIPGHDLWGIDRKAPWKFFNVNDTFIHPFKWLLDAKTEEGRQFACQSYLPFLGRT
ncbi:uncharacterized protein LOC106061226 [Biomphalaria glabrata]|uniref:Uncharacterized protein LOC106061226 n=1 Tax=Biomphalaria glabrata TaxID=6526 RepID=A0A9W3AEU7_BIOGL|nr:uncharacterized protein LOC106061226 [Biomphalaria glabrata]